MRRVCLKKIHELARRDDRVVYIGSDPSVGTLEEMQKEFPDRFFIEGISEANVIGMAAGLAMEGYIPLCQHDRHVPDTPLLRTAGH